MAKELGTLIRQVRTEAGLTQEELARKIAGLSAADISRAERGEEVPTQAMLKKIAKATGVTQASLLEAARGGKTTAKKTSTRKTTAKKSSTPKTPANANSTMKVTATERKLVEAYRAAGSDERKAALKVLRGECSDRLTGLLGGDVADTVADLLGDAIGNLLGGK